MCERPVGYCIFDWILHRHRVCAEARLQERDLEAAQVRYERDVRHIRLQLKPTPKSRLIIPFEELEYQAAKEAVVELINIKGWEPGTINHMGIVKGQISIGDPLRHQDGSQTVCVTFLTALAWYQYGLALIRQYSTLKRTTRLIYNDQLARIKMGECLS